MTSPRVTVLMPVYNGEAFLHEAIDSILNQTFQDFEFLIINDGSTDSTEAIIQSYTDPRIRYEKNPQNLRLIATLNKGIDLARGEYIARMDADDISMPNRLEKQVIFMDSHPEVGLLGAAFDTFNENGHLASVCYAATHEAIQLRHLYQIHLSHGTGLFRVAVLKKHQLYFNPEFSHAEDYELWSRLSKVTRFANLPDMLYRVRHHAGEVSNKYADVQLANSQRVRRLFFTQLGLSELSDEQLQLYIDLAQQDYKKLNASISKINVLLEDMLQANKNSGWLQDNIMKQHLEYLWFNLCYNSGTAGKKAYNSSILAQDISFIQQLKWSLKLLLKR